MQAYRPDEGAGSSELASDAEVVGVSTVGFKSSSPAPAYSSGGKLGSSLSRANSEPLIISMKSSPSNSSNMRESVGHGKGPRQSREVNKSQAMLLQVEVLCCVMLGAGFDTERLAKKPLENTILFDTLSRRRQLRVTSRYLHAHFR